MKMINQIQDPEGSRLLYTISGDYFSVNPNSGEVTLIKVALAHISLFFSDVKIKYFVTKHFIRLD